MSLTSKAVDVLAIGAHPDDVELGCGATLALLVDQGHRVGILHLTRGELGTRGTPEMRQREAEAAAAALGVHSVDFLDLGDGGLRRGAAEEDAVIGKLRTHRPRLVFLPPPRDRHPDHRRAHVLARDSCFYAGLEKRRIGTDDPPHRPECLLSYYLHHVESPSLIIDVSSTWPRKVASLAAYRSQLTIPAERSGELEAPALADPPQTRVSSPAFFEAIDGRSRHFGLAIGVSRGEPFFSASPLAVRDVFSLMPRTEMAP